MDVALPLLLLSLLGVVSLALAITRVAPEERRWLFTMLLIAFVIRMAVATIFALAPSTRAFHDDATGYERLGMAAAAGWHHAGPPIDLSYGQDNNYGYFYVCAGIYYVMGAARAAPSYVNALLGTLTAMMVYGLARRFFVVPIARRASLMVAFFPSMILWNSVALKDTLTTFLIVLSLKSCITLKKKFSLASLFGTLLPVLAMQPVRFYLVYFVGLAIALSLWFERGSRALSGIPKQILVLGSAVALLIVAGLGGQAIAGTEYLDFERINTFRQGMASTAASGFAQDVDVSSPLKALVFLPVGVSMLLFSPFPWQISSGRAALALPEMVVWWLLIPSLWRGIRVIVKSRLAECSPILIFSGVLTLAYSLIHGNVGSGFRQRAQIFVFLFIFTSVGVFQKKFRKARLPDDRLFGNG